MGAGRRAARLAGVGCVALATLIAVAAWPAGAGLVRVDGVSGTGTPVLGPSPNAQYDVVAAGGGGQSLVVWVDQRSGSFDLYGARVGTGGMLLDPVGFRIAKNVGSAGSAGEQHVVGFDGTRWLVVWRPAGSVGLFAARIDTSGTVLDPGGFALTNPPAPDSDPAIAANPAGGFLVVWHRAPVAPSTMDTVRGALFDANGAISLPDHGLVNDASHPAVAWGSTAAGASYLLEYSKIYAINGQKEIYLTSVRLDGTSGGGGSNLLGYFNAVTYPRLAGKANDGWIMAFEESNATGPDDVFVDLPKSAFSPGARITVPSRYLPEVSAGSGGFLLADIMYPAAGGQSVVVAPVTAGPAVGSETTVALGSGTQASVRAPAVGFDGTDWLVADTLLGSPRAVWATNLNASTLAGDGSAIRVSTSADRQEQAAVAGTTSGYAFAWTDRASSSVGMELIDGAGTLTPVGVPAPATQVSYGDPSVAPDPNGWVLAYDVAGPGTGGIRALHASTAGAAAAPFDVSTSSTATSPATAFDGAEDLVAYLDGTAIHADWVTTSTGTVTQAFTAAPVNGALAPAAAAGGGKVLVTWIQPTISGGPDGDVTGVVLDHASATTPQAFAIATGIAASGTPAIGSDGTGFLVAWQQAGVGAEPPFVVRFAAVDAAGNVGPVYGPPGSPSDQQVSPTVTFDGTSYIVAWQKGSPDLTSDILGTRVASNGTPIDTALLPLAAGITDPASPALASDGAGHTILGYKSFVATEGGTAVDAERVQATRFHFDKAPAATAQTVNATEDTPVTIQLAGTDPDGDALTFALDPTLAPGHGTLSGTPPALTYTPDANYNGDDTFGFTASDGVLVSPPDFVTIHVAPVNDPPVVDPVADASVDEGSPLVVGPVTFIDPDAGDTWTASADIVGTGPGTLNVTASSASAGKASVTIVFSNDGTYDVELCVTDQAGGKGCSPFTVTVANVPPSVTGITTDPSPATEGASLTFTAQATDPGADDVLTYAWTFDDGSTSTDAHPTHTYANDGTYAVSVSVSDGTDTTPYAGSVVVENVAPTPVDPGPQTVAAGKTLTLDLTATDPGADTLTWKKAAGVGNVTAAGHYTWTPAADGAGSYTATLQVADGDGGTASLDLAIDVTPPGSGITTIYGCSSAGGSTSPEILALLLALFGLLVLRRRPRLRARHASVLVVAIAIGASPLAHAAGAKPKLRQLAFLGIRPGAGVDQKLADTVGGYVYTELARIDVYQVMSMSDIKALLGLEAKKQLMGCSDGTACLAQIGGALGAERLLTGDLSRVGDSIVLNLSLLDVPHARQVARVGTRAEAAGSLDAILDAIPGLLRKVAEKDGLHVTVGPPEAASLGRVHFVAGLRGEGELLGPGGALGIEIGVRTPHFGASLVGIPRVGSQPNPSAPRPFGLRLEGRVTPWQLGRVLPYLALGATVFFPDVGARGALGVEIALGQMRLSVDVGAEYLLNAAGLFAPLSVLVSGGVAYAF